MRIGNTGMRGPMAAGGGNTPPQGGMNSRGQIAGVQLALEERVRRLEEMIASLLVTDRAGNLSIVTRGACVIDAASIRLRGRGGQIVIDNGRVDIDVQGPLSVDAASIAVSALQSMNLSAGGSMNLLSSDTRTSSGMVTVDAGMLQASGTIRCDTIIATTVVGASYTPGAGNIM
jgi:hypothetical protein